MAISRPSRPDNNVKVFEKRIDGVAVARAEFAFGDGKDVLARLPRDQLVYTVDPPPSIEAKLLGAGFRRREDFLIMRGPIPEPGRPKIAARVGAVSDCRRLVGIGDDTYPIHLRHDLAELEALGRSSGCRMYALLGPGDDVLGRVLIDAGSEVVKIRCFGIRRDQRGQGGGRYLLASSMANSGNQTVAQAVVIPDAVPFYNRLGWRVVRPLEHWVRRIGVSENGA